VLSFRRIAGLIAVLALVVAAPASAKPKPKPKSTVYTAELDCGSGTVTVVSGADMFAPLVEGGGGPRRLPG
jgi:hypothetical protein